MSTVERSAPAQSGDVSQRDRICARAIEHFGRFGFDQTLLELSIAADVEVETLTELFGSVDGLHDACDDYIQSAVRKAKSAAMTSHDPDSWFSQVAAIESFAPMITYLVRTLQAPGDSGKVLLHKMIDNMERYLEDGVRAGTLKPTQDPSARATFLAMCNAGGLLLYLRLHGDPSDMAAVLRDYSRDMLMPALELYTYGLLADDTIYQAFLTRAADQTPSGRTDPDNDAPKD